LPEAVGRGFDELVQQPGGADGDTGCRQHGGRRGYSVGRQDRQQGIAEHRVHDVQRIADVGEEVGDGLPTPPASCPAEVTARSAKSAKLPAVINRRWLVVGCDGMLGQDLVATLGATPGAHEVTAVDRDVVDITDPKTCVGVVEGQDIVVNAAAWTAVDDAETHEAQAFAVNAVGAANVARACAASGARMVQVSTDYVFAGDATSPYAEDAPLAPRSAYGRTKGAGEWAVRTYLPSDSWVVRTAWLYGAHGQNFVKTMARLASERDTVSVVDDQRGQPTWTVDLAEAIVRLVTSEAPFGTYHGTSCGETTWFGFAQAIFAELGLDPARVRPITADAFPLPAPRPAYSVLGHDAWQTAGVAPIREWSGALAESITTVVGGQPE
jgi:dTDP-4-dehydrorhamnose reductase